MNTLLQIGVKRQYNASIERVWQLITDQQYLSKWLMPGNFKPEVGYDYQFLTDPNEEDCSNKIYGTVLEVNAPHSIKFTWRADNITTETTVEFKLKQVSQWVEFSIFHDGFGAQDQAQRDSHDGGWLFHAKQIDQLINHD